jgi:hypothetical protein
VVCSNTDLSSNRLPVSYYSVIPTTGAGGVASAFFGFPPLGAVGVGLGFVEARFLAGGIINFM